MMWPYLRSTADCSLTVPAGGTVRDRPEPITYTFIIHGLMEGNMLKTYLPISLVICSANGPFAGSLRGTLRHQFVQIQK
jgi:hypothetical protein